MHLVVAGDGAEHERIARAVPPGRVHFLGWQRPDGVARVFQACDVMVLPSAREGWPNVVTEALASGLPVVAAGAGEIPTMITGPDYGEIVARDDAAGWVAALDRVLCSPPNRAAIRRHAEQFAWVASADTLVAHFRQVFDDRLGREPTGAPRERSTATV